MGQKIQRINYLAKSDLQGLGLDFTDEQLMYCNVAVFKVLSHDDIVVFREGDWTGFPFKDLQERLGRGVHVVSVDFVKSVKTTIIAYGRDEFSPCEKEVAVNVTGEEFALCMSECSYLRPPFKSIFEGEM